MLESIVLRVGVVSLTCSAVLLPLLLLTRRLHHRYAARTCYFLWLLLALRLVLPVQITLPTPAVTVEAPSYVITIPAGPIGAANEPQADAAPTDPDPAAGPSATPARTVSLMEILGAVWLTGAAVYGGFYLVTYAAARRRLLSRARPAGEKETAQLRWTAKKVGCSRSVGLYQVKGVGSPMVLGLVRPVILLPARAMGEEELTIILRHELTHLKRWDIGYKLLLLAANGVHWFNPLVWWMTREAERNLELCCDDDVVRRQDKDFRRLYGEVLLRTARDKEPMPALSTRFSSGKAQMKGRLMNLFQKKRNSALPVCLVLASAVLLGSLVACESTTTDLPGDPVGAGTDTSLQAYIKDADPADTDGASHVNDPAQGQPADGGQTPQANGEEPPYINEDYGFALRFPAEWAGLVEVKRETDDGSLLTLYQKAGRKTDDPTAGVLGNVEVCPVDDFNALYGDTDLEGMYQAGGPRIWVLGTVGENLVYLHVDRLPENGTWDTAFLRLHQQLEKTPGRVTCVPT